MARITVEDCIDKFPSRFELVLVASQRTRKLFSGETPTVEKNNDKNTVIALREIAEGIISIEEMKESLIEEYQTITISDEEEENLEIQSLNETQEIDKEQTKEIDKEQTKEIDKEQTKEIDKEQTEDSLADSGQQIEKEIKELSSTEESNLKEHYEISDDLQSAEEASSSEKDEQEAST